ncbi:hypothetical protein FO440_07705 [Mucilaginibacter corticis]|uniref:IPT/TIG domain-containing protein n=1 Tax=Mucilaginibacter corticis TaxID=2597670 RepID=A0A556MVU2_9SPHI|nr:IPT/TIG domain-containing protein [Mucilaginibacter corticis]TSJ44050.1 hypothetical protein FO440_07705 [Mucilaginibacter corticis]
MIINYTKLSRALSILFIATVLITTSCSKKSGDPNPSNNGTQTDNTPTITSISVSAGTYNTLVIISGTNFSSAQSEDKVYFNGKAANVTLATSTQLEVNVPNDAGTGAITISVNGGATITGPAFTYISVTSIDVNSGGAGTVVKITGTGFSATATNNKVSLNGKDAKVTDATTTQITFIVPSDAGTAPIKLIVSGITLYGPVFNYIP